MHVRWLSGKDVEAALPMDEAVAAVKSAYISAWRGETVQPLRLRLDVEEKDGVHLVMPSSQSDLGRSAVKIVSVFPNNSVGPIPVITGVVALFDGETGAPLALIDGATLTAVRTGAASGAATDALANPDARVLAVLGAGAQAPYQALGVCAVRRIEEIRLYNRTRGNAEKLAARLMTRFPHVDVQVFTSPEEAVAGADVICTATSARAPILRGAEVSPGAHVNAVGSFRPDMRELGPKLLQAAGRVFVEQKTAAFEEAGELVDAFGLGLLQEGDLVEIGAVLAKEAEGRRDGAEVTVFKSTGIAAQDLHAATRLVARAERLGIGTLLEL